MDEAVHELQSLGHRRSSALAITDRVLRRATSISQQLDVLPTRTIEARLDLVQGRVPEPDVAPHTRRRRSPHWIGPSLPPIVPAVCPGLPMHSMLRRAKFSHPGPFSSSPHNGSKRTRSQRRTGLKLPCIDANEHRDVSGHTDDACRVGERLSILEDATAARAPPEMQPAVHVFLDTESTNPSLARFEQSLRRKRAITDASTLHGRRVATKARRRRGRTRTVPIMITQGPTSPSPSQ